MYDLIQILNANSTASITVNDDVYYPVERFTWSPTMIGDDLPRLQGPGRILNFKDIEVMTIEMEGHIKADTTDLYWTARRALLDVVIPDFDQTIPQHGSIRFKINGDTNIYVQTVQLTHYEIPTEALYPTVTPFRFEWDGILGYWQNFGTFEAVKL